MIFYIFSFNSKSLKSSIYFIFKENISIWISHISSSQYPHVATGNFIYRYYYLYTVAHLNQDTVFSQEILVLIEIWIYLNCV